MKVMGSSSRRMVVLGVLLACVVWCGCVDALTGYQLTSLNQLSYGYQGSLSLLGPGPYGDDVQTLALEVYFQTQDVLRIKIYDPANKRWEVPNVNQLPLPTTAPSAPLNFAITFTKNPFGFAITRKSNNDVIFNSTASSQFGPMIFEDQYLEMSTILPNNPNIYGLGERVTNFRLPVGHTYTMWNHDTPTPPVVNLYGTHPFYLEMRNSGNAHGVFMLNSNAQDWILQQNYLTYKTIGGIFDMFVFLGPNPATVIQQYSSVVGTPHFPPYWGLGWHQCRYGYHTLQETMEVVANYSKYGIPLDTMWNDIDYMDKYEDFTNDPTRFPQAQVRQFVEELHANDQHYIMIIDPGIAIDSNYSTYKSLLASGAYIRASGSSQPITGKVWPGAVIFPDFLNNASIPWWYNEIEMFHSTGPEFDGMWIDMNELSNFCNGQCAEEVTKDGKVKITFNSGVQAGPNYDNPPYVPGGSPLDTNTLNVTSVQAISISYNTHNLYGWSEGIASNLAMEKLRGTRSMVISRSTFAGSGTHNGHWLGDNHSTFEYLYNSIAGVLSMQLFGIPFVGADICGFLGDTTEELCARWMQLGSLYPFARNHNDIQSIPQEPYVFGQPLINISISALNTRYTLLPYFYTLFYSAHTWGLTVWEPLFFEFPTDTNTFGIDAQFLVGPFLLASPVVTQGATSVSAYFPAGVWYSFYTGTPLISTGAYFTLDAPLEFFPIHIRGGGIIPTQVPALTTAAARKNPFGLIVALDQSGHASGDLYLDDGESLGQVTDYTYLILSAGVDSSSGSGFVQSKLPANKYGPIPNLELVTVYGVPIAPSKVTANNNPVTFTYNTTIKSLVISVAIQLNTNPFSINWSA